MRFTLGWGPEYSDFLKNTKVEVSVFYKHWLFGVTWGHNDGLTAAAFHFGPICALVYFPEKGRTP